MRGNEGSSAAAQPAANTNSAANTITIWDEISKLEDLIFKRRDYPSDSTEVLRSFLRRVYNLSAVWLSALELILVLACFQSTVLLRCCGEVISKFAREKSMLPDGY